MFYMRQRDLKQDTKNMTHKRKIDKLKFIKKF